MSLIQRVLSPVVEVRREEAVTVFLMFLNSFTAIAAYTAIKPLTRSAFIDDFGATNLPWVQLVAGMIIGVLMSGYAWMIARLSRRWALPMVQFAMAAAVLGFWVLFQTAATWVSVAFYLFGLILAVLLISQFWTLANVVYDPRQAKRLFGFIGGGASLGGVAGSTIASYAPAIGSVNLLLPSAAVMALGAGLTTWVITRERVETGAAAAASGEKGVSLGEAFRLLRESRHLQIIALVISFGAVGAAIIDQQVNMAAEARLGGNDTDAITRFLALVQLWTSVIGFVVQVWLTSRIHRYLGIGFALMILPISLGLTATLILVNGVLWAAALARVLDTSLRYTVDKTTREILFLPLSNDIKLKAKSFVDVTVDRGAKAAGALLLLLLVQPWGFALDWRRLSYASLTMMALWIVMALRARRGYLTAFRQSIERRDMAPAEVRLNAADLSTIETLVEELAHPEPPRVIYAIDLLESLDKQNLVTPLLLHHEDAGVRERALRAMARGKPQTAARHVPQIRRLLADPDSAVRAAAVRAISVLGGEDVASLTRPLLHDPDARIRTTAAVALATTGDEEDVALAETALVELAADPADRARRDVAGAIKKIPHARFRRLLIPLLYDSSPEVADEAMESVRLAGTTDFIFVPTLVSLLRHRRLKGRARAVLVGYGEPVVDVLAHFMRDPDEDIWVRRHIPATLALIESQKSVDVLVAGLEEPDGFLRYKIVSALERLRRVSSSLAIPREPIEALAIQEAMRYFTYLSLHHNLVTRAPELNVGPTLLGRALEEKIERTRDRIFRLLSLIYPWKDIAAAQWTLEHGDARSRASASEYLDNVLTGQLRKRIIPVVEDLPVDEKVRRGNVLLRTRPRDAEESLLQLINDDDQVVAAAAIDVVRERQMWTLGDDVEHVLAHRDLRDWYVFEAASWALAERRMPAARRRELWLEPLPAAELAARLRTLPLFSRISVDELFRIAGASRQVRHEPGSVLVQEGAVPEHIHFLLDGRVTASSRDGAPRTIEGPATLGFDEALQGLPTRQTVKSAERAVTLVLSAEELRTLLSDNTDLVRGLFSTLTGRMDVPGCSPVEPTGAASDLQHLASADLSPVEKVLALERVPVFSRIGPQEMTDVAALARPVALQAGTALFPESAEPALWLVLSGEVSLENASGGVAFMARPGDTIGTLCAVGGRPLGLSAAVVRDGVALRIGRDDLFELLGERPELLRQLFAGMFALEPARQS